MKDPYILGRRWKQSWKRDLVWDTITKSSNRGCKVGRRDLRV
jgi:hypothetical protein